MMVVPGVLYAKIKNDFVVFEDEQLSMNNKDGIVVTSVSNISEDELKDCLNTVLNANSDNNKNMVIDTVQYSKRDKKVYFYTDRPLSIRQWEEQKKVEAKPNVEKPLTKENIKTIRQIEKIVTSGINKDETCVSLYDIGVLLTTYRTEYEMRKNNILQYGREGNEMFPSNIHILDFDSNSKELIIGHGKLSIIGKTYIGKQYDLTYVRGDFADDFRAVCARNNIKIPELYNKFFEFSPFLEQYSSGISVVDSTFKVDINKSGLSLYRKSSMNPQECDFKVTYEMSEHKRGYNYECDSAKIVDSIRGNEKELLKSVFVKIEDCPEWMRPALYSRRLEQLSNEKGRRR